MTAFEALGRDAVAAANSLTDDGTGTLNRAVIGLLDWFGDTHGDHLLEVSASKDADGATITVTVKERDVYVAPAFAVPEPVLAPTDPAAPADETDTTTAADSAADDTVTAADLTVDQPPADPVTPPEVTPPADPAAA